MGWAGQTWLRIVEESTYGVFNSGGATCFPRLYTGDSFTVRRVPQRQVIRTADAGNRRIQVVAARRVFTGTLTTLLYPTQAAYWATAMTLTGTPPALPSYSIEFFDSVEAWRLLGGEIQSMTLTSTAEQDYVSMTVNWIFQDRDVGFTSFAQPAQSSYPVEVPYEHYETASNCTLGGTAFTKYKNITVTMSNVLVGTWDEGQIISAIYYCGRDFDFNFGPQYLATTLRGDYEQQTPLAFVLEWIRGPSAAHTLTFDLKASDYLSNVADQLPLDGPGYQMIDVQAFFDKTALTDYTMVAT